MGFLSTSTAESWIGQYVATSLSEIVRRHIPFHESKTLQQKTHAGYRLRAPLPAATNGFARMPVAAPRIAGLPRPLSTRCSCSSSLRRAWRSCINMCSNCSSRAVTSVPAVATDTSDAAGGSEVHSERRLPDATLEAVGGGRLLLLPLSDEGGWAPFASVACPTYGGGGRADGTATPAAAAEWLSAV
eukprot:CAMPEP_0119430320 /NCGR_PEP_ID=MMETSP1335-20130426/43824_1 /TAXON_ID=259385 /ORGANISM="Chrysoculter rhomboideus, Strain RCC1486" /LENGTH=186 /DNA_ID=CAMNT_0007456079 /DNA_START=232 /DNA_END=789 /DNA_ORIENTATION=+